MADYCYLIFEVLSILVYCLLQKIKRSSDLPVIDIWNAYMLPDHSCFRAIEEKLFFEGTRTLSALEKVNSNFLKNEFRRDFSRFLEDFVNKIPSTVAARSLLGQRLSCFYQELVIGGDDQSGFHLLVQLLDGLLELGLCLLRISLKLQWNWIGLPSIIDMLSQQLPSCRALCGPQGFSQRDFFTQRGNGKLRPTVTGAATVCEESSYEPWTNVLPERHEVTVVDLKKAYGTVVVGQKNARDTSKRWLGVQSGESSEVGEPSCWTVVRISDVVEVGPIEYLPESVPAPDGPSSSATVPPRIPGKRMRESSAMPAPDGAPDRLFEFDDESIVLPKGRGIFFDDPTFEVGLEKHERTVISRRSGCNRRAAPVFKPDLVKLHVSFWFGNCLLIFKIVTQLNSPLSLYRFD